MTGDPTIETARNWISTLWPIAVVLAGGMIVVGQQNGTITGLNNQVQVQVQRIDGLRAEMAAAKQQMAEQERSSTQALLQRMDQAERDRQLRNEQLTEKLVKLGASVDVLADRLERSSMFGQGPHMSPAPARRAN